MAKEKGKHLVPFVVFTVLFLFSFIVCFGPSFNLTPGSLSKAIIDGLSMFVNSVLKTSTILPLVLLFLLLALDFIVGAKFYTIIAHCFGCLSAFFAFSLTDYLQLLPSYAKTIAIVLFSLSCAESVFVIGRILFKFSKSEKKHREKKKSKKEEQTEENLPSLMDEKTLATLNRAKEMSDEEALNALTSVNVPNYECYQQFLQEDPSVTETSVQSNIFDIAYKAANVQRENQKKREEEEQAQIIQEEVNREKLAQIFRPRNIERAIEEDRNDSFQLPEIEDSDIFEFKLKAPTAPEPKPVKQIPPSSETTIIDEGSEPEDMEEDLAKKPSNKGNIDLLSAVGGLKSAKEGAYLYDSSKFTYKFPSESLLKHYPSSGQVSTDMANDHDGKIIVETLAQFRVPTELVGIQHGPTFTMYELSLGKGIRVNTVQTLSDNLAMDLAVQSVRILAPIPGKSAVGIEVPNKKRDTIGFDVMMPALKSKELKVPMVLGKTITGDSVVIDLAGAPHLLIAGTTGSGKSVCVNSLICSILYTKTPKQVRMILVDPKMVELTVYNDIPHLLTPVITEPKKAIKAMAFIVEEMERRMSMFSQLGARKIEDYNEKILQKGFLRAQLPYIVVVIDEFADLMTVVGKELEAYIKRITAVARFTGIHLVLATQRPSADVITGIIKSNMPTQIAFAVSNQVNSRIILDSIGAEKLLGRGDMLYASASNRVPQRIQGAYIDSEIEEIVKFVKTQGEPDYIDESYFEDDDDDEEQSSADTQSSDSEDMFTKAWKIVADKGEASASYLQRRLSIGYNRAANLIEQLEEAGYIGPARGSKPREVLRFPDSNS